MKRKLEKKKLKKKGLKYELSVAKVQAETASYISPKNPNDYTPETDEYLFSINSKTANELIAAMLVQVTSTRSSFVSILENVEANRSL